MQNDEEVLVINLDKIEEDLSIASDPTLSDEERFERILTVLEGKKS